MVQRDCEKNRDNVDNIAKISEKTKKARMGSGNSIKNRQFISEISTINCRFVIQKIVCILIV